MLSSQPLQPPCSVNSTAFLHIRKLLAHLWHLQQFTASPQFSREVLGGFYLIPFLRLWVPTLSPRSHYHMTWGLRAWPCGVTPGSTIETSQSAQPTFRDIPGLKPPTLARDCCGLSRAPPLFFMTPTFHTAAQCCDLQSCQTGAPVT